MTAPEQTNAPEAPAVGAPVEQPVRPRAWAIFVDNGNARMWSTLQPHVQKLADAEGLTITPLYDQAALDAAVAAVRDRMRDLCAIDMASATLKASELAQAAERERWRKLVEQCRDALAEELSAWDIDPPLHHVKEAHDACVAWLLRA